MTLLPLGTLSLTVIPLRTLTLLGCGPTRSLETTIQSPSATSPVLTSIRERIVMGFTSSTRIRRPLKPLLGRWPTRSLRATIQSPLATSPVPTSIRKRIAMGLAWYVLGSQSLIARRSWPLGISGYRFPPTTSPHLACSPTSAV